MAYGYLNYNVCEVAENHSRSSNCQDPNSIGIDQIYVTKVGNLSAVTISASGICTSITMTSGKKFYSLDIMPESSEAKFKPQRNKAGNTTYLETVTTQFNSWGDSAVDMTDILTRTDNIFLVKKTDTSVWLFGLTDQTTPTAAKGMQLSDGEFTSGKAFEDELNGGNLTFIAKNSRRPLRINAALLTSTILA